MRNLSIVTGRTTSFSTVLYFIGYIVAGNVYISFFIVPINLQSVVMMFGVLHNPKASLHASITYLALGLLGLPMFPGLESGVVIITTPAFGYLIGFSLASYVAAKYEDCNEITRIIVAELVLFACGIFYIFFILSKSWAETMYIGLEIFCMTEIIKATLILKLSSTFYGRSLVAA